MKIISLPVVFVLALITCNAGYSAIVWTNTAGGSWSDAAGWDPNQVPGAGDDAAITNGGIYTVTLDTSPTVNSLTLGGNSGTQTLATAGQSLTLNNPSIVNQHGILFWANGGSLYGILTVATNGLMIASGAGSYEDLHGTLTNAGTILLTNATYLRCYGDLGGAMLINLPGGLVYLQDEDHIASGGYGNETVVNQGTVRKSGGSGISYIYPAFYNSGTLDVLTGEVDVYLGEGDGVFKAEAGATLNFFGNYELEGVITGAGTNLLTGGTLTGTNGVIAGGTLTWTGGNIGGSVLDTLTIATNGALQVLGDGVYHDFYGALTNAGEIQIGGTAVLRGLGSYGVGNLINLAGGLVDLQGDGQITFYYGTEFVLNEGLVRKSGGTNTSYIYSTLYNFGTVNVQSNALILYGGEGNGLFVAGAGTTLGFAGNYTVDSGGSLTGAGTNLLSSGTFTLNGSVTSSNAVLDGATLTGIDGFLGGNWIWKSGAIGSGVNSTLTLAGNSVLVVTGDGVYHDNYGTLTNAGTIQIVGATILRTLASYGAGNIVNLPGGSVDLQGDGQIYFYYGSEFFLNEGILRKSGGAGVSSLSTHPLQFRHSGRAERPSGCGQRYRRRWQRGV